MKKRWIKKKRRVPGVQLLPNLLTTGSLFSGFFSMIATFKGEFEKAAVAIIVAIFFDGVDGKVARLTRTESRFGIEYDSLSDLVAFGVAPSLLVYSWALIPLGRPGWLAAFVFTACVALRLARYNVEFLQEGAKNFRGLPSPAAAGMVAATVLFYFYLEIEGGPLKHFALLIMVYLLSLLMVSNIRYYGFKEADLIRRRPFGVLFLMVLLLTLVVAFPQTTMFFFAIAYISGGILLHLLRRRRRLKGSSEEKSPEVLG